MKNLLFTLSLLIIGFAYADQQSTIGLRAFSPSKIIIKDKQTVTQTSLSRSLINVSSKKHPRRSCCKNFDFFVASIPISVCEGEDGSIITSIVGGTAPYSIFVSLDGGLTFEPLSTSNDLQNGFGASNGTYIFRAIDKNGCVADSQVTVNNRCVQTTTDCTANPDTCNNKLTLTALGIPTSVCGDCLLSPNITLVLSVQGGTGPYQYFGKVSGESYQTLGNQTNETIFPLVSCNDTFFFKVVDNNGCCGETGPLTINNQCIKVVCNAQLPMCCCP